MRVTLDLHVHSAASYDGRMPIEEIVRTARARGLDAVAVCDHDRVYTGKTEFDGLLVIPGVEFSTEYGHLLGLFVDRPLAYTGLRETAQAVHQLGGLLVLAHPFANRREEGSLAPLLPYLDGVEVWNGRAERKNPRANAMAEEFAKKHGLRPFGGSDAHLAQELGNGVVVLEAEALTAESLRAALLAGEVQVSGVRGSALCVARSQWTKLRKGRAAPFAWLKWTAFAAKCVWEDGRARFHR